MGAEWLRLLTPQICDVNAHVEAGPLVLGLPPPISCLWTSLQNPLTLHALCKKDIFKISSNSTTSTFPVRFYELWTDWHVHILHDTQNAVAEHHGLNMDLVPLVVSTRFWTLLHCVLSSFHNHITAYFPISLCSFHITLAKSGVFTWSRVGLPEHDCRAGRDGKYPLYQDGEPLDSLGVQIVPMVLGGVEVKALLRGRNTQYVNMHVKTSYTLTREINPFVFKCCVNTIILIKLA